MIAILALLASVFVIDRKDRVRWQKIETDYRRRVSVEQIREAIDQVIGKRTENVVP